MKKLLFIILLAVSGNIYSQVQATFNPFLNEPGVLVNKEIKTIGLFSAYSYADVDQYYYSFTKRRFIAGLSLRINDFSILAGYTRTNIKVKFDNDPLFNPDKTYKNALSLGFIAYITKSVSISAITDVYNWETHIGFGINVF